MRAAGRGLSAAAGLSRGPACASRPRTRLPCGPVRDPRPDGGRGDARAGVPRQPQTPRLPSARPPGSSLGPPAAESRRRGAAAAAGAAAGGARRAPAPLRAASVCGHGRSPLRVCGSCLEMALPGKSRVWRRRRVHAGGADGCRATAARVDRRRSRPDGPVGAGRAPPAHRGGPEGAWADRIRGLERRRRRRRRRRRIACQCRAGPQGVNRVPPPPPHVRLSRLLPMRPLRPQLMRNFAGAARRAPRGEETAALRPQLKRNFASAARRAPGAWGLHAGARGSPAGRVRSARVPHGADKGDGGGGGGRLCCAASVCQGSRRIEAALRREFPACRGYLSILLLSILNQGPRCGCIEARASRSRSLRATRPHPASPPPPPPPSRRQAPVCVRPRPAPTR